MRMLHDSHVFVWFVLGDPQCRPKARELIVQAGASVFVSSVMLAAQSQVEDMPLITADRKLDAFGIRTIW